MTKFVGSKTYSYLIDDGGDDKKQDTQKCVS